MDSSGFLTLIAVLLTAVSLLSEGRKITYKNRFSMWHLVSISILLVIIIWCLFYDFFASHNLILPYPFISGFGPSQLVLLISLILLGFIPYTAIYGKTRDGKLEPLCESMKELLSSGKFGELLYVLTEHQSYFSEDNIKIKQEIKTKEFLRRLLTSHRFNEHLRETSYELFHFYVSLYPEDEFFNTMYCQFIRTESINPNSLFNWEVANYRSEGAQNLPSEDTPYIRKIYESTESNYQLYLTLTRQFEELINCEKTKIKLNEAPDSRGNYCRDPFISKSPESLILFLVINAYHNDLRQNKIPDIPSSERRVPWLIVCHQLLPLIDKKESRGEGNNEYESRIDYLLWESMKNLRSIVEDCNDKDELEELTNSFANVAYKILINDKYSDCFKFSIVKECIRLNKTLPHACQLVFKQLCNRNIQSDPRDSKVPTQLSGRRRDIIGEAEVSDFLK